MAKRPKIKESSASGDGDDGAPSRRSTRKRPRGRRRRRRGLKSWWRDARWWGLPAAFGGTGILFFLGVTAIWFPQSLGPGMADIFAQMGPFGSYFFLLGLLLFLIVAYNAAGYMLKRREFMRLVATKSKGDFIRTQDRIERLAFDLGSREQDLVTDRKQEFRIRH